VAVLDDPAFAGSFSGLMSVLRSLLRAARLLDVEGDAASEDQHV
jgi:hypothetical protein